jgi:dTMP kinase
MKPLFIVFEGIDGSGKTTQAERLKSYLIEQGDRAVISAEPTEGVIGKLIRTAMQDKNGLHQQGETFDRQMAYLFAADRHYHLFNDFDGVYSLLQRDRTHVIATRYFFSSLAYNSNNPQEYEFVYGLNQHFPNPDWVIYINLPLSAALQRLSQYDALEVYETEHKLRQVQANYEKMFRNYSGRLLTIDGTKPIDSIHSQIVAALQPP